MKTATTILLAWLSITMAKAQKFTAEKVEIQTVINQVRHYIQEKDSANLISLFTPEAFVWVGVLKNQSQLKRMNTNKNARNYFPASFQTFYKFLTVKETQEEVFKDIQINNDDVIGNVTFNYKYMDGGKLSNWGKEFWHLIKMNGKWKIVSVVYSIEPAD